MSQTAKNLAAAFAGESQANRKYTAFAKQAEQEGHIQAAKLFRAAAEAETIHALSHLKVMNGIKSTTQNLQAAIEGETYENTEMYPGFIKQAEEEGNQAAVRSFRLANEAEQVHAKLYKEALDHLNNSLNGDYYLCTVCGHIHLGNQAPDQCPICGAKSQAYKKFD